MSLTQREIDTWEQLRQEIKSRYLALGLPEEEANERATKDMRRQIRKGPPIALAR